MPLHDARSACLPYCLMRQDDGTYVTLNREYKPIGWTKKVWVDYGDYPIGLRLKGMTAKKAARLDCQGRDSLSRVYFYDDGCIPTHSATHMTAYLARLAIFAKMKIDPGGDT